MDFEDWPDCTVAECLNKCCLALDSPNCFPHTEGNEHVKRLDIDVRRILHEPVVIAGIDIAKDGTETTVEFYRIDGIFYVTDIRTR